MVLQTQQGDGKHRLYGGGIRKASFLMPDGEHDGQVTGGSRRHRLALFAKPSTSPPKTPP
jgi:hypothetical protein